MGWSDFSSERALSVIGDEPGHDASPSLREKFKATRMKYDSVFPRYATAGKFGFCFQVQPMVYFASYLMSLWLSVHGIVSKISVHMSLLNLISLNVFAKSRGTLHGVNFLHNIVLRP